METDLKRTVEAVKRWQLSGTDGLRSGTSFSTWTPLNNKQSNAQLFEERVNLVLHWFDLWTDKQRKHLLHSLLTRCAKTQLTYCRDLLKETVPVTQVDFTAVLPRFLSLYVLSFLSPRDLCSAAQVSWHWRALAEQDCIWASRCTRRGWFLPYTPGEKEYGAWKSHYISCVSTLDWLTPREVAEQYGTLNQQSTGMTEEEEERRNERRIRGMIRGKLQEEKRLSMRTRKAWGSLTKQGVRGGNTQMRRPDSGITSNSWPSLSWRLNTVGSSSPCLSRDGTQSMSPAQSVEGAQASTLFSERPNKACGALSSFTHSPAQNHSVSPTYRRTTSFLFLISDRVPAYELVLSGVKAGVTVIMYDHRGTPSALLTQVKRAISGERVQRLGLLAPGGTEEIYLLQSYTLSERTLLTPDHREFWEKLCGWVAPTIDGGGIDIFSPLAASASGVALIQTLSTLTGVEVWAPMGFATGSFQNILSEWSSSSSGVCAGPSNQQPASPGLHYVTESVLEGWCRQAEWIEEALGQLRVCLGPQLQQVGLQARSRALGHYLWEKICLEDLSVSKDLSEALTEGLAALTRQEETRPLEFLTIFFTRWSEVKERGGSHAKDEWRAEGADDFSLAPRSSQRLVPELPQTGLDWRGVAARELHHSECLYLGRLGAVLKVYQEPLAAALNSNRAIISYADIQIILSPVVQILELNRVFLGDLQARLQQWGAEQCVGDVFVKLCSGLRVYTSYLNNYTTALCTIDKCRETKPSFRAFLKRADRTLATHMLSLQELLLCPVWRIQEYVTLLQALSLHTHLGHPDHTHISSALNTLRLYRDFIQKLKRNSERDRLMEETQQMIQGCPNLREGNRQLIITQDAALLRSPDEQIPDSLRTFEQVSDVGLFLFNDALMLTRRTVHHTPFTLTHQSMHTFLASVALTSLAVREITHTRYVHHAFVLDGPHRSWVCATERGEERDHFLSVLRSAINVALTPHQ